MKVFPARLSFSWINISLWGFSPFAQYLVYGCLFVEGDVLVAPSPSGVVGGIGRSGGASVDLQGGRKFTTLRHLNKSKMELPVYDEEIRLCTIF